VRVFFGVTLLGRGQARSPGSGGASPSCAGTPRVNLPLILTPIGATPELLSGHGSRVTFTEVKPEITRSIPF
jgi:hypothetical protein